MVKPKQERSELNYRFLNEAQRADADKALIEAVKIHFTHDAVKGIPNEEFVARERCINSRCLLVNKKEKEGGWECKGRWIVGGQNDPDLGRFETTSPTAIMLAYTVIMTLCLQWGWETWVADVSAAFLQGEELPRTEPLFVRIPKTWPMAVQAWLAATLGPACRHDIVRVVKGIFGLAESPRLWYQKFRKVLIELGFFESSITKCLFIKFKNFNGKMVTQALIALHVDDAFIAGDDTCGPIWDRLKKALTFGDWQNLRDKPTKFCGRFLFRKSDEEFESDIGFYGETIHGLKLSPERKREPEAEVTSAEYSALQ
jgi:hypothetical protein